MFRCRAGSVTRGRRLGSWLRAHRQALSVAAPAETGRSSSKEVAGPVEIHGVRRTIDAGAESSSGHLDSSEVRISLGPGVLSPLRPRDTPAEGTVPRRGASWYEQSVVRSYPAEGRCPGGVRFDAGRLNAVRLDADLTEIDCDRRVASARPVRTVRPFEPTPGPRLHSRSDLTPAEPCPG